MAALCSLVSAGLIEKDSHGDVLWTWSYPCVSVEQRKVYMNKGCLARDSRVRPWVYGQYQGAWYYIYSTEVESTCLPKVKGVSLVLTTRDFHPEKYETLCCILCRLYLRTGNPADMLEKYLSVITKGMCNGEENGTFSTKSYDHRQAYAGGSIRSVVSRFGIEVILLYTALLLKKRIAVYHSDVEDLLNFVRTLPAFVWHRQNWNILHPLVSLNDLELADLKSRSSYVAGFTDASIESRSEFYDVFVNLSANEIIVTASAKEALSMGKVHKDLATFLVRTAEREELSDQLLIKEIAIKTKELLSNLRGWCAPSDSGKPVLTLETLREKKLPAATENFLFSLAAAEGFVQT